MTFHMQMPGCSTTYNAKNIAVAFSRDSPILGGTCRHTLLEYAGDECFLTFLEKQTLKPYKLGLVVMFASLRQACSDTPAQDMHQELAVLIDALDQVGCRGEVKVSEWIRGSKLSWTDEFNKKARSYNNHCGKDINFWRSFMRQCSVNKLVDMELRSMIKSNGHYSVYGVFLPTDKGREAVTNSEPVLLPHFERCNQLTVSRADASGCSATSEGGNQQAKGKRIGKESHILPVIRKCLKDSENWKQIESKQDYQFLGTYAHPSNQNLYFIPDLTELEQRSDNPHYLWNDIQFSKGQLNKDRKIEAEIGGKKENVYYRTAPCIGVKTCTVSGCTYIAPIHEKHPCPHHKNKLVKSEGCPVEFVYVYPEDGQDKRRWIGGLVRCQKYMAKNLHNNLPHAAMKISQCVKERMQHAIASNPTLTPTDIACGKGVVFTPSAVDVASSHLGRVAREVKKVKESKGFTSKNWSPCDFELTADEIDQEDEMLSGDLRDSGHTYKSYGRPYLCAAGIEESIQYVVVSSPLMSKLAAGADFMQCDITYNETREYPYIFNAVVFNYTTMEWMVIGRIRMNKQDSNAYALAFRKLFSKIKEDHPHYSVGETLLGLVVDWSDAQIKGLQHAIGKEKAEQLLKGCKVHWLRSCQRVAEKVSQSHDRSRERNVFESVAKCIPHLKSAVQVIACFEALCGVRTIVELLNKVPSICRTEDAQFVEKNCDWTAAKNWAQWWTRATHLRMLSKTFSSAPDTWTNCPTTTNAVERKNKDCKTDRPQPLKLAMINIYRIDKNVCCKHIAAEQGASISYRSRDLEAKKKSAATRQQQRKAALHPDRTAQHGPPDRVSNFVCDGVRSLKQSSKRKSAPNPSIVQTGTKKKAIKLKGIKFGEMAKKGCILILAKFKLGDLELYL